MTATHSPPPTRARNRLTLLLIVSVFVLPIVVAWFYSTGILSLSDRKLVNRGQLVSPPLDLSAKADLAGIAPLFALKPSEWSVVLLQPDACADACGKILDDLLILRELLGQGAVRVSVHAITGADGSPDTHVARVHPDPAAIAWLQERLPAGKQGVLPAIVLVDWRHQLVMRYAETGELSAIQRDLKRLLRASAIK